MICSRSIPFLVLSFILFAFAEPQPDKQCEATRTETSFSTVVQTVTVTARLADNSGIANAKALAVTTSGPAGASSTSASSVALPTATCNSTNANAQSAQTLDPCVIAQGFADDGQDVPAAGQAPSLTSTNNFINFCLTLPDLPITDGKQTTTGSCNPAPIGAIPSTDNIPSAKFVFPVNFAIIKANETFPVQLAINNLETGWFVNAESNFLSAPQQLGTEGQIKGHSHIVIEALASIGQTTPVDPRKFVFFKGLNSPAQDGKISTSVPGGLVVGFYRLSSITTASNHQPIVAPIAQHGAIDDSVYFTVTSDGMPVVAHFTMDGVT